MGLILLLFFSAFLLDAQEDGVLLRYSHEEGDLWNIVSQVQQTVTENGFILYETEILNKISAQVTRARNGDGLIANTYSIAEKSDGRYIRSSEHLVSYARDVRGRVSGIPQNSPVPTVRNVPVFPENPLLPGEEWEESGSEIFDLNLSFGIPTTIIVRFLAHYRYLGRAEFDGVECEKILVNYAYNWAAKSTERRAWESWNIYPLAIQGQFTDEIYFDGNVGKNRGVSGTYSYAFHMSDGSTIGYSGTSHGRADYPSPLDRAALVAQIESHELEGVKAQSVREGVRLSLEDIRFLPDSAQMLPGEEEKLERIAKILLEHPERDIVVVGHTAKIPGAGDGQELSEQRARTVANYFLSNSVRQLEQVVVRGEGHQSPVADNRTEAGRRQNRRVEITILEN